MSEKKKKFIPFKDAVTSRRPVILKSDREPKDFEKAKSEKTVEKEKQPTILLKPRETSVKDDNRSQSPTQRQQNTESMEAMAPSKIAQNEHKERKMTDPRSIAPIPAMQECVKLLDEKLELNPAASEFLHDSNSNYLVVGILGAQGVGKSLILNILAHDKLFEDLCSRIMTSHEMPSCDEDAGLDEQMESHHFVDETHNETVKSHEGNAEFKFKMQDIDQIERAHHCTKGIDMYVTSDRVILLDSQALFSPCALEEGAVPGATPVTVRGSTVATVDCLQLASYLMSVCHVLIVAQDWFTDYNFLRLVLAAEMLKPSLSGAGEGDVGGGRGPHLLLLHNRCELEDYRPDTIRIVQEAYRKVLSNTKLQLNSGMYLYSDQNRNGPSVDAVSPGLSVDACGPPINLFLLPEIYDDYDNREIYRGHPPFSDLARRLQWMVYGVNRLQITNVPNLSEKSWFHYASKAWETVRKSTFFMEYGRLLP